MYSSFFAKTFPLAIKLRQGLRLVLHRNSILNETGYLDSYVRRIPQDANGGVLPWLNYAMIDFLGNRLNKNMSVFEYGAGYSTLFFAQRVGKIVSLEYNPEWVKTVRQLISKLDNSALLYRSLDANYVESILEYDDAFSLVLIDGRERVRCSEVAMKKLAPDGVVILDDSKRDRYAEIRQMYADNGFHEITFSGLKPLSYTQSSSTIFYRERNCLGI